MRRFQSPFLSFLLGVLALPACSGDGGDGGAGTTSGGSTDASVGSGSMGASTTAAECAAPVSHAAEVQPIWDANCVKAGCHAGPNGAFALVLEDAYDKIVNVPSAQVMSMSLVAPGDPEGSYLLHKIRGTQESVGGGGEPMPADAPQMQSLADLDPEAVDTVERWIACGAEP